MSSLAIGANSVVSSMPGDKPVATEVGVAVLKKALSMDEQSAAQLLQAVPSSGTNNPSHLGNTVDTRA